MDDIASLERDKREYQEQLDIVQLSLNDDPDNAELTALKAELDAAIALIDETIQESRQSLPITSRSKPVPPGSAPPLPPSVAQPPPPPPPPPPAPPSSSSSSSSPGTAAGSAGPSHARSKHNAPPPPPPDHHEADAPAAHKVNDEVQAKWLSGDKGFYPARITSITGSASDPIFLVTFKGYGNTETLRSKDIRSLQPVQKRKSDAPPPPPPSLPPTSMSAPPAVTHTRSNSGTVLSAAATLYPQDVLQGQAKRSAEQQAGGPAPKKKKIKAKGELEASRNMWKEFSSKSKTRKHKESMFRTPESITARVGFTGSGQAMRKDPTRSRHVYQTTDEAE